MSSLCPNDRTAGGGKWRGEDNTAVFLQAIQIGDQFFERKVLVGYIVQSSVPIHLHSHFPFAVPFVYPCSHYDTMYIYD